MAPAKRCVSEYGGARSTAVWVAQEPFTRAGDVRTPVLPDDPSVRGSTTITRSFWSSLASTSPLGSGSASETGGWGVRPARFEAPAQLAGLVKVSSAPGFV